MTYLETTRKRPVFVVLALLTWMGGCSAVADPHRKSSAPVDDAKTVLTRVTTTVTAKREDDLCTRFGGVSGPSLEVNVTIQGDGDAVSPDYKAVMYIDPTKNNPGYAATGVANGKSFAMECDTNACWDKFIEVGMDDRCDDDNFLQQARGLEARSAATAMAQWLVESMEKASGYDVPEGVTWSELDGATLLVDAIEDALNLPDSEADTDAIVVSVATVLNTLQLSDFMASYAERLNAGAKVIVREDRVSYSAEDLELLSNDYGARVDPDVSIAANDAEGWDPKDYADTHRKLQRNCALSAGIGTPVCLAVTAGLSGGALSALCGGIPFLVDYFCDVMEEDDPTFSAESRYVDPEWPKQQMLQQLSSECVNTTLSDRSGRKRADVVACDNAARAFLKPDGESFYGNNEKAAVRAALQHVELRYAWQAERNAGDKAAWIDAFVNRGAGVVTRSRYGKRRGSY